MNFGKISPYKQRFSAVEKFQFSQPLQLAFGMAFFGEWVSLFESLEKTQGGLTSKTFVSLLGKNTGPKVEP